MAVAARFAVHRGWNTLPLTATGVRRLRVVSPDRADLRASPSCASPARRSPRACGFHHARGRGARPRSRASGMAVVLQRTTADFPYRRPVARPDAEDAIDRSVTLPVARRFAVGGWASVSPAASDAALDRLAGIPAGWSFTSSGRLAGCRAGVPPPRSTGADRPRGSRPSFRTRRPWLAIRAPHPFTARRLTLGRARTARGACRLRVVASGASARMSPSAPGVSWTCPRGPHPRSAHRVVLTTRPAGTGAATPPAVAVGEVRCADSLAASGCGRRVREPLRRTGAGAGPSVATARVSGTIAALDAGRPLPARRLSAPGASRPALGASRVAVAPGGTLRADHLELDRRRRRRCRRRWRGERWSRRDEEGDGSHNHVRLRLDKPAWLVYGESYSSRMASMVPQRGGEGAVARRPGADLGRDQPTAGAWGPIPGRRALPSHPSGWPTPRCLFSGVACVGMLLILLVLALRPVARGRSRPRRGRGRGERARAGGGAPLLPTPIACSGRIRSLRSPAAW